MSGKKNEQQKHKSEEKKTAEAKETKLKEKPVKAQTAPGKNPDGEGVFALIKPPLVLMIICLTACLLLVGAYNLTYVDTEGVITKKLQQACEEVMTGSNFSMLTGLNLESTEVSSIIINEDHPSQCAFEVVANGYNKGGLHLVIGINDGGSVTGISVAGISETPGLGTKISDEEYLAQYRGVTSADSDGKTIQGVDNVTGATYSSKGVKRAVAAALSAYEQYKGEIFQ